MKVMDTEAIKKDKKTLQRHDTELYVHQNAIGHPFLVGMHYYFETKTEISLILDYCPGGDLARCLRNRGFLTEDEARLLLAEIVLGVQRLHKLGVVHRDLKPANILLSADGHVAITDFGLSERYQSYSKLHCSVSHVGTTEYFAPEVIERTNQGPEVDWWAVGVMTYEVLTGCKPFKLNKKEGRNKLFEKILHFSPVIPGEHTFSARHFTWRLMLKDPTRRLGNGSKGAEDVRKHRFFSGIDWEDVYHKRIRMPFKLTDYGKELLKENLRMLLIDSSDGACEDRAEENM